VASYPCGPRAAGDKPTTSCPPPQHAPIECVLLAEDRPAGPAPWTVAELLAIKHRPDAPNRRRGVRAAHGSLSRVGAGCTCPDCLEASAAWQRERERREAERQFPPEKRAALIELLSQGMWFKQAAAQIGVSPKQIWGRARSDPAWGAELQATIDRARPTDIVHGRQSAYRRGCRCSECRAAR
jgi:hypothetical protein